MPCSNSSVAAVSACLPRASIQAVDAPHQEGLAAAPRSVNADRQGRLHLFRRHQRRQRAGIEVDAEPVRRVLAVIGGRPESGGVCGKRARPLLPRSDPRFFHGQDHLQADGCLGGLLDRLEGVQIEVFRSSGLFSLGDSRSTAAPRANPLSRALLVFDEVLVGPKQEAHELVDLGQLSLGFRRNYFVFSPIRRTPSPEPTTTT
jgi:hypothetical protein